MGLLSPFSDKHQHDSELQQGYFPHTTRIGLTYSLTVASELSSILLITFESQSLAKDCRKPEKFLASINPHLAVSTTLDKMATCYDDPVIIPNLSSNHKRPFTSLLISEAPVNVSEFIFPRLGERFPFGFSPTCESPFRVSHLHIFTRSH